MNSERFYSMPSKILAIVAWLWWKVGLLITFPVALLAAPAPPRPVPPDPDHPVSAFATGIRSPRPEPQASQPPARHRGGPTRRRRPGLRSALLRPPGRHRPHSPASAPPAGAP